MALTTDLGRRIELVPMDSHFHDISIGLYLQQREARPEFLVHTYSPKEGAQQRVEFVAKAMVILGGMKSGPEEPLRLRFPCHAEHRLACRRIFLESCKVDPAHPLVPRPLAILDKKSNRSITVTGLGGGVYQLTADGEEEGKAGRVAAVAGGLIKLGELQTVEQRPDRVAFACGQSHDAAVGMLLVRALNVRAVLREEEMVASRGILSAPSARKE